MLEDLDRETFASTIRANRLKKFKEILSSIEDNILKGRLRIFLENKSLLIVKPIRNPITRVVRPRRR